MSNHPPSAEGPLGIPGFRYITYWEDDETRKAALITNDVTREDEATLFDPPSPAPVTAHGILGFFVGLALSLTTLLFSGVRMGLVGLLAAAVLTALTGGVIGFMVDAANRRKWRKRSRERQSALARMQQFMVPVKSLGAFGGAADWDRRFPYPEVRDYRTPREKGAGHPAYMAAREYVEARGVMWEWPDLRKSLPDVPALAAAALEEHLADTRLDDQCRLEEELRQVEELMSRLAETEDSVELDALRRRRDELSAQARKSEVAQDRLEEAAEQVERLMVKARARAYLSQERG